MEDWLDLVTKDVVIVIDAMALIVVVIGTIEAFFTGLRVAFPARPANPCFREAFQRYGRWLVAGLTFQLAADIIETSIAPSWQEVWRLGAIAAIRTFLNFFLERDLSELRERGAAPLSPLPPPRPSHASSPDAGRVREGVGGSR
jgi:uncharacterized membrane protein